MVVAWREAVVVDAGNVIYQVHVAEVCVGGVPCDSEHTVLGSLEPYWHVVGHVVDEDRTKVIVAPVSVHIALAIEHAFHLSGACFQRTLKLHDDGL